MMPKDCWEGGVLREAQSRERYYSRSPCTDTHTSVLPVYTNHHYVHTYVLEQLGWDQQHTHVNQSKDIRTWL